MKAEAQLIHLEWLGPFYTKSSKINTPFNSSLSPQCSTAEVVGKNVHFSTVEG